jgi:hypothetical protein
MPAARQTDNWAKALATEGIVPHSPATTGKSMLLWAV